MLNKFQKMFQDFPNIIRKWFENSENVCNNVFCYTN